MPIRPARIKLPPLLLLSFLAGGAGLRLYCLGCKFFQEDETYTFVYVTKATFRQLAAFVSPMDPYHPPLYWLFLKVFSIFWRAGEVSLRFPSALFGVLSIWVIYKIGVLLKSSSFGLMISLLLAFSPAAVFYAQFARSYSADILLGLISLYCLLGYLRTEKISFLVGYLLFNMLGVFTHFYFLYLLVADGVSFLLFFKRLKKSFLILYISFCSILGLVLIPNLSFLWGQWSPTALLDSSVSWFARIMLAFFNFCLGDSVYPFYWPVVLPAAGLFGGSFLLGVRHSLIKTKTENLLLLFRFAIPLLIWIFSGAMRPRYLAPIVPYFLLFATLGVESLRTRTAVKNLVIGGMLGLNLISLHYWYTGNPEQILDANLLIPWKDIAQTIEKQRQSQDWVLLYPEGCSEACYPFQFQRYYPTRLLYFASLPEKQYGDSLRKVLSQRPKRLWLVDLPRSLSLDTLDLGSCYQLTYQKGFLSNPHLTTHFQTGKKSYRYAATVHLYERLSPCE